ncbi:MAG TPA: YfiR family protein [Caulobacteraceae bacterium]
MPLRAPRIAGALPAGLAVIAAVCLGAGGAAAQSLEYPVKANYLVRFAAFVTWPPSAFRSPSAPITICVVGQDPFGRALDTAAAGQRVGEHPIVVRRMPRVGRDSGCHIAYLGRNAAQASSAVLTSLNAAPVLTVTDDAVSGDRGVIHFVLAGNRVRFHADQRSAESGGMRVDARLLSLALTVAARR